MEIQKIIECVLVLNKILNRATTNGKSALSLRAQVLLCCHNNGGETTVKELKDNVKIAKTNLAILCNTLCDDKCLSKEKDATDLRSIKYKLLSNGQKEIDEFLLSTKACFEKILNEKEQDELNELTKKIIEILK